MGVVIELAQVTQKEEPTTVYHSICQQLSFQSCNEPDSVSIGDLPITQITNLNILELWIIMPFYQSFELLQIV